MVQINASSLESFVAQPTAVHGIMLDVEAQGDGFALVVRSKDKTVVGQTKTPDRAEKRFNDATGARTSLVVATDSTRDTLDKCAGELLGFYTSEAGFAERFGALSVESQRLMGVVGGVFGAQRLNRNGWKCGSFHAINDATAQAQAKDAVEALRKIQKAASALNNSDVMRKALVDAGADSAVTPDQLQAAIAALLGGIGLAVPAPAPTGIEPTIETPTEPAIESTPELVGAVVESAPSEPASTEPTSTRKNRKNR
jgi:hypothetical protein